MTPKVVCFDLDDTLYKEIDFVESAFSEIAISEKHLELLPKMMGWYNKGENVFLKLNKIIGKETIIPEYQKIYRSHFPKIELSNGVEETLNDLKERGVVLGIITDGRSLSQRNKLKALDLERWFEDENIIISEEFGTEKTDERNFRYFIKKYPKREFTYVGDNPKKDFVVPNRMGWNTVMLKDDGRNIHKQDFELSKEYLPQHTIINIVDLLELIK